MAVEYNYLMTLQETNQMDEWLRYLFSFFGTSFIVVCTVAFKKTDIYYKFIRYELGIFGYCLFGASAGSLLTINIFHDYIVNINELTTQGKEIIEDYYNVGFNFLVIMLVLSIVILAVLHGIDKIIFSTMKKRDNVKNDES